jgi:hypothetical protein
MTERTRASITFLLTLGLFAFCLQLRAQQKPVQEWIIESLHKGGTAPDAGVEYDFRTQIATITNGAFVKFGEAVLTAETAALNYSNGDVIADGNVHIEQGERVRPPFSPRAPACMGILPITFTMRPRRW